MRFKGVRGLWWVGIAVLALAAVGIVALWPQSHKVTAQQPSRAREYKPGQACLLTPSTGLADPQSAQAWAGLEDASAQTHVQVRYLSVAGQDTVGNAAPYLASLAVGGCGTVVVAGEAEVQVAAQDAQKFSNVEFVLLGGMQGAASNVKSLASMKLAETRAQVSTTVAQLGKS